MRKDNGTSDGGCIVRKGNGISDDDCASTMAPRVVIVLVGRQLDSGAVVVVKCRVAY